MGVTAANQVRHALIRVPFRSAVFRAGLALRLLLILFAIPLVHADWFVPFLQHANISNPFDPWATHLAQFGDPKAFPYGFVMYVAMWPGVALGTLLEHLTGLGGLASVGLGLTVLLFDVLLMILLLDMKAKRPQRLLVLYWLSPIVIYICYWHGQLDILPVVLLVLSLSLLFRQSAFASGVVLAAGISAKLSMALALPIVVLYLFVSKRRRKMTMHYLMGSASALIFLSVPVVVSPSARMMVFGTPELTKIYDFSIPLSEGLEIYLVPVTYLLILLSAWLIRRISSDLLIALLGVGFLAIVLMTPASPGWYLWVVPFLVAGFVMGRLRMTAFAKFYGCFFVSFHLLRSTGAFVPLLQADLSSPLSTLSQQFDSRLLSLLLSLLFASGVVLCILLIREGVIRNDYFRLSRRPLLVGIAGDSGAGKDTLADAIIGLVGIEVVTHVSGDDYHLWDRHKPMWQVMTHLNPSANDLLAFREDLLTLAGGSWVQNRHYDHSVGRRSKPMTIFSNEVIIASGLHALYDPVLCSRYDVRIFLDMDDSVRRFLKVQRDVHKRGHRLDVVMAAIERRASDRDRFIQPQAANADLIFTLQPLHPRFVDGSVVAATLPSLKLHVAISRGTPYESLVRTLVGVCGLHVDIIQSENARFVEITLEGDADAEDVAMAARELIADMDDLMSTNPEWQAAPTGIMQLFVVNQVAYALRTRLQ
jgi:uridine kinase